MNQTLSSLESIAAQQTQGIGNANAFFLGLLSATYSNLKMSEKASALADYLASIQDATTGAVKSVSTFFSTQSSDYILSTAMAAIAWEKANIEGYLTNIQSAVTYLASNLYIGYYPTLQNVLALRAITTYISYVQPSLAQGNGTVQLLVDGSLVSTASFSTAKSGVVKLDTS